MTVQLLVRDGLFLSDKLEIILCVSTLF